MERKGNELKGTDKATDDQQTQTNKETNREAKE
jgi:hypothetical protein